MVGAEKAEGRRRGVKESAEGGTRTRTGLRPLRPERSASTSSTTSAKGENLIPRHPYFNPIRPRVDSPSETAHTGKPGPLQHRERLHRADPVMAVGHDLRVTIELAQAFRELAQRYQPGTFNMGDLPLVRLA